MRALLGQLDVDLRTLCLDTMLAAYLLDPAESRYLLADLLLRYTGLELSVGVGAVAPGELQLDLDGDAEDPSIDAARRALAVARLVEPITAALDAQRMRALHDDSRGSAGAGARQDGRRRASRSTRQSSSISTTPCPPSARELTRAIWDDAGEEFNVNSTLKLREILFDRLGLQPTKKTKTGFSTDAASLEKLDGQHPIIEHLLRYREVEKLRSTYGEGLLDEVGRRRTHPRHVQPDRRPHRPLSARTRRTCTTSRCAASSAAASARRSCPPPGCELLVADYNQIELRCIAHLAEDPGLIAAFDVGRGHPQRHRGPCLRRRFRRR